MQCVVVRIRGVHSLNAYAGCNVLIQHNLLKKQKRYSLSKKKLQNLSLDVNKIVRSHKPETGEGQEGEKVGR
jgi:hypothetical protein